jgi:hypothetical protein
MGNRVKRRRVGEYDACSTVGSGGFVRMVSENKTGKCVHQ